MRTALLIAALAVLTGCAGGSGDDDDTCQTTNVRFWNQTPDRQVLFWLDVPRGQQTDMNTAADLDPGQTADVAVTPGNHSFDVALIGPPTQCFGPTDWDAAYAGIDVSCSGVELICQ